jgi:hypothetical protein
MTKPILDEINFNYSFIISNYKTAYDYWDLTYNSNIDERLQNSKIENSIKSVLRGIILNIRDKNFVFSDTNTKLEDLKVFYNRINAVVVLDGWVNHFFKPILQSEYIIDPHEFINAVRNYNSPNDFFLKYGKFKFPYLNIHFPHLFSIIKNIMDDKNFPIFYPFDQGCYMLINEPNSFKPSCSYDDYVKFYQNFKAEVQSEKPRQFATCLKVIYELTAKNTNRTELKKIKQIIKIGEKYDTLKNQVFFNELKQSISPIFNNNIKMYKYYLKKVSKQDKEKTTVLNQESLPSFFDIQLDNRDDEETINLFYLPENTNDNIVIRRKQDTRIFIDREKFNIDDILLFERLENETFSLTVINKLDSDFDFFNNLLNNKSFILTDNIDLELDNLNETAIEYLTSPNNKPLNQILYGPPGTGKTYNSVNKALEIIDKSIDLKQDRDIIRSEYEKYKKNGQILFTTFHQSLSYEDFIEGIKPQEPVLGESLKYEIQAGIFKIACARAGFLCQKKYNELIQKPILKYEFDDLFDSFIESVKKEINKGVYPTFSTISGKFVEIFEINKQGSIRARPKGSNTNNVAPLTQKNIEKLYNKFISIDEIKSLETVKETVGIAPRITEFYAIFKGIKEFESNYNIENTIIDEGSFLEISDEKKIEDFDSGMYTEAIKNAGIISEPIVLIIDEINRGNVSQIFGELITLIEDDKRLGKPEYLEAILAYSKSNFGVPPNLHIVGTMNTADRSVEALDTALRRRFVFEEMPPEYGLEGLQYKYEGIEGFEILKTINHRIEKLLNKDHQIGHSYLILKNGEDPSKKLLNSFYKNIIPLLQEYFYGDFGKIGLVLGQGFVNLKSWDNTYHSFANFEHENVDDFKSKVIYEIIDYRNNVNYELNGVTLTFGKAIKLLMNISIE